MILMELMSTQVFLLNYMRTKPQGNVNVVFNTCNYQPCFANALLQVGILYVLYLPIYRQY